MANYTNVIASNICDAAGNKLASGTVSFQATDAANQPLNFQVGGGGQVVTTPATAAITAGAIAGGFQVADSANTSPAGVLYRITITDTTLNRAVVTYSLVTVTGTTFSLDTYAPSGASVLPPVGGSVNGPLTVTGNLSVTGSLLFGSLGVSGALSAGLFTKASGSQALQSGFAVNTPTSELFVETGNAFYFTSPQAYFSRVDSTPYSVSLCPAAVPLAACDAPIVHVSGTNTSTTNIPGMVGVEVDLFGFKANDFGSSPPQQANYIVGFGAQVQDAAVDNITNLRGANFIVDVNGLPTHVGPGGFVRSGVGLEVDTNNSSGVDAVPCGTSGAGNCVGGITLSHNGPNSASFGIDIASSAATGKGYRAGVAISGVTDVGLAISYGGAGSFSPTYGIQVGTASSAGIVVGTGTTGTIWAPSGSGVNSNPTTGILLDAQGTTGVNENQPSNTLSLRAKNSGGASHNFTLQHTSGAGQLNVNYDGGSLLALITSTATLQMNGTGPTFQSVGSVCHSRFGTTSAGAFLSSDSGGSCGTIFSGPSSVTWGGFNPSGTFYVASPTTAVAAGQLGIGTTSGFGNGAAGTAVTTTTKNTGTGPTTPQTIVNYLEVNLAGTNYWVPLVQ
jgi:hypothetical protein